MYPEHVYYVDDRSVLILDNSGRLKRLFCPFPVTAITNMYPLKSGQVYQVQSVKQGKREALFFEIQDELIPLFHLRILNSTWFLNLQVLSRLAGFHTFLISTLVFHGGGIFFKELDILKLISRVLCCISLQAFFEMVSLGYQRKPLKETCNWSVQMNEKAPTYIGALFNYWLSSSFKIQENLVASLRPLAVALSSSDRHNDHASIFQWIFAWSIWWYTVGRFCLGCQDAYLPQYMFPDQTVRATLHRTGRFCSLHDLLAFLQIESKLLPSVPTIEQSL